MLMIILYLFYFFFFQAEDGIRDVAVTGVQTCALPISERSDGCGAGHSAGGDQQQCQQEQQDAVGAVGVHQRLLGRTRTETGGLRRSFNVVRRWRTAARIGSRRLWAAAL